MEKNLGNSNIVTTNQIGPHEDLMDYLGRYHFDNYQRPLADFSRETWEEIKTWVADTGVIFDLGCGVGESTYYLAKKYPEFKIVGIDRSVDRLDRKNHFKKEKLENILLLRGELLDLIPLMYQDQSLAIKEIYILYPNPYPKKHHIKRRFHGNPVSIFLFNLHVKITLRSNWKLYLDEFSLAAEFFERKHSGVLEVFKPENITPFETKFVSSGQKVFELNIFP